MKKSVSKVFIASLFLLFTQSCSKEKDVVDDITPPVVSVEQPTIKTAEPSNITTTTISAAGKVEKKGNLNISDRGFCWHTTANPTINNNKILAGSVTGAGDFSGDITGLTASQTYYVKAYVETSQGVVYGNEIVVKTADIKLATLTTDSTVIIGKDVAWFGGTVSDDGGDKITAKGVCFSTSANPTVSDSKVLYDKDDRKFTCVMEGMLANTTYYVRAFATNAGGTAYGNNILFKTLVGGSVRYTLHKQTAPTADQQEAYEKITSAMNTAIYYYNRFSNINKNLNVYYEPSVATADGNINGTIRFGAGRVYMNPGTSQHEIAHTIGVGQSNVWNMLIVNGVYTGKNANAIHQWIISDPNATILEDGQGHFKPYQFNVPNAPQTTLDYIYHALIMEGMRKDGLPIN